MFLDLKYIKRPWTSGTKIFIWTFTSKDALCLEFHQRPNSVGEEHGGIILKTHELTDNYAKWELDVTTWDAVSLCLADWNLIKC